MTFYNVISGILFLGACQAFLRTLGTPAMWAAATLVVTILNESVITSELIERQLSPVQYKLSMKLLDFLAFMLLSWALLVLLPAGNTFDVDVSMSLWGAGSPVWFWGLLTVYWGVTLAWNHIGGQRNDTLWRPWFFRAMHAMWVPTALAAALTATSADFDTAPAWVSGVVLALSSAYFVGKLFAKKP